MDFLLFLGCGQLDVQQLLHLFWQVERKMGQTHSHSFNSLKQL